MKILHIIDSGGLYGAEVMLLNLVAEQIKQGLTPLIASIGDHYCGVKPLETEARRRGLQIETFRMRPGPNFAGAFKVLRFARREGVDILHSHGYKPNILFGLMPKGLRRIPMVATLHGWICTGGCDRMRLYECLDRLSLRFIDRVVVVTEAMCAKVKVKNLCVVNNGIPINESDTSNKVGDKKCQMDPKLLDFCQGGFTIGAIGRLSPEKGYDILLKAVKEVAETNPEVRLVILGEGDERFALEEQVKRLGLEQRVLMPGYVENARLSLPLFRMFALSSLTEGLPIVILEAMQAGVPIVATKVGGIADVLENGTTGILVDPSDPVAFAEALRKMINEPSLLSRFAENGKKTVHEKYSSSKMTFNYLAVYNQLLGKSTKE
jgi:glycosyltransferase involved in cell wall biosynthesis